MTSQVRVLALLLVLNAPALVAQGEPVEGFLPGQSWRETVSATQTLGGAKAVLPGQVADHCLVVPFATWDCASWTARTRQAGAGGGLELEAMLLERESHQLQSDGRVAAREGLDARATSLRFRRYGGVWTRQAPGESVAEDGMRRFIPPCAWGAAGLEQRAPGETWEIRGEAAVQVYRMDLPELATLRSALARVQVRTRGPGPGGGETLALHVEIEAELERDGTVTRRSGTGILVYDVARRCVRSYGFEGDVEIANARRPGLRLEGNWSCCGEVEFE